MTPRYGHTCHWPGCTVDVAPKLFMCKPHWFTLPSQIRSEIWRTYRPGQERDKNPSETYLKAARNALNWIAENCPSGTSGGLSSVSPKKTNES